MVVFFLCRCLLGLVYPFLTNEPLQLPLPDESFYLLLQVIAFGCVITVVVVKTTILIFGPLVGISLQLTKEYQGFFVLDLH